MKTIKYKCDSAQTPARIDEGDVAVKCINLYEGFKQLSIIMKEHIAKGDTIVYRRRHALKVAING